MPVEFTVGAAQLSSNTDKKTHLHIFGHGTEDFNGLQRHRQHIKAQGTREEKFSLVLTKKKASAATSAPPIRGRARAEAPRRTGVSFRVSAEIDTEETGLQADNYRDMVVEVRKKVPILMIGWQRQRRRHRGQRRRVYTCNSPSRMRARPMRSNAARSGTGKDQSLTCSPTVLPAERGATSRASRGRQTGRLRPAAAAA